MRDSKIEMLRELPAFAGGSRRELRALSTASDLALADAGRVLLRADRLASEAYLIIQGEVDVVVGDRVVASLGRGDFVGELGVIDGQPRSADVIARTDVALLAFHASNLRALIERSHALRTSLLRQVAERVRRMDLQLEAV